MVQQGSSPSITVLSNLYTVSTYLQAFRNKYYPSSKIKITSGWRSSSYNAKTKGAAPKSQHIQGKALDFVITNQNMSKVWQNFKKFWKYGYMVSYSGGWIHGDIRNIGVGITNDK